MDISHMQLDVFFFNWDSNITNKVGNCVIYWSWYISISYNSWPCNIKIFDGVAIAVFSDRRLAKDMYNEEKRLGIDEVYFKERLNCLGTKYPDKTKEEIAKILTTKFQEHNIKIMKNKKWWKNKNFGYG